MGFLNIGFAWYLPERILVADGDGRKLQMMFVFHADVNVLGM